MTTADNFIQNSFLLHCKAMQCNLKPNWRPRSDIIVCMRERECVCRLMCINDCVVHWWTKAEWMVEGRMRLHSHSSILWSVLYRLLVCRMIFLSSISLIVALFRALIVWFRCCSCWCCCFFSIHANNIVSVLIRLVGEWT